MTFKRLIIYVWFLCLSSIVLASFEPSLDTKDLKILGKGTYGKVYKLNDSEAVKVCSIDDWDDPSCLCNLREVAILYHLQGTKGIPLLNKVKLTKCESSLKYFIEIYMPLGEPIDYKTDQKFFLRSAAQILSQIHKHHVVHRDIKDPHWLVIDSNLHLFDWGSSSVYSSFGLNEQKQNMTTSWYRSPENIMEKYCHGQASDVWATAVSLFHGIWQQSSLCGTSYDDDSQIYLIIKTFGSPASETELGKWLASKKKLLVSGERKTIRQYPRIFDSHLDRVDSQLKNLLNRMFEYDPKKRITPIEMLEDPYLKVDNEIQQPQSILIFPQKWNQEWRSNIFVDQLTKDGPKLRESILKVMKKACERLEVPFYVLFDAISIFDRFFLKNPPIHDKWRFLTIMALHIASEFNDQNIDLEDWVKLFGLNNSQEVKAQLLSAGFSIVKTLEFRLIENHPVRVLEDFLMKMSVDQRDGFFQSLFVLWSSENTFHLSDGECVRKILKDEKFSDLNSTSEFSLIFADL